MGGNIFTIVDHLEGLLPPFPPISLLLDPPAAGHVFCMLPGCCISNVAFLLAFLATLYMSPFQVGAWIYLPGPASAPYSAANVQLQAAKQQPASSFHQPIRPRTSPGGSQKTSAATVSAKDQVAVGEAAHEQLLESPGALQLPFCSCSILDRLPAHPTYPLRSPSPSHSQPSITVSAAARPE